MNRMVIAAIVMALLLGIDAYVLQAIRTLTAPLASRWKLFIHTAYWVPSAIFFLLFLGGLVIAPKQWPRPVMVYGFSIFVALFFAKIIISVFLAADDIRRLVLWLRAVSSQDGPSHTAPGMTAISRSVFLSWLGITVGGGFMGSMVWGFRNKYRFQVRKVRVTSAHLPEAFRGLRMVHISDIHSGSFTDLAAVERGVQKIMDQNPDIIFFTGDLVNDHAGEMDPYKDLFSKLKAPMGVYSCLGNHDYGDYKAWPSKQAKAANLERLKSIHEEMGWRLLMNEHVPLEREGHQIALLGIENWGAKGFGKYGRLQDAYHGTEGYPFRILLSHDPSHWEAQVLAEYPDIDLMLSGHTHGMQFGVEIPGFRWSPVQYLYRQWAGLYQRGRQSLYVNRGFGFLGYPGRVGILPEITVIELG